jgi:hypothetical protein
MDIQRLRKPTYHRRVGLGIRLGRGSRNELRSSENDGDDGQRELHDAKIQRSRFVYWLLERVKAKMTRFIP